METAAESEELAPQYDVMTSQDIPSGERETLKLDETLSQSESEIPDWLHEPAQIEATPAEEGMIEERKFELSEVDIQEIYASPFSTTETDLTVEQITEAAAVTSVPFLSEEEEFETPASIQESPDETYLKFSQDILDIPGIDPEIAKDLKATGIYAPLILLKRGATPQGRQTIASRLGVSEAEILALASYVDLLRIQGLKLNDMQAFKLAGIVSILDLAAIDAMKLRAELLEISGEMESAYSVPGITTLENWINQARSLPQVIN